MNLTRYGFEVVGRMAQVEPPAFLVTKKAVRDLILNAGLKPKSISMDVFSDFEFVFKTPSGKSFSFPVKLRPEGKSMIDLKGKELLINHDTDINVSDWSSQRVDCTGPVDFKRAFVEVVRQAYEKGLEAAQVNESHNAESDLLLESLRGHKFRLNGTDFKLVRFKGTHNLGLDPVVKSGDGSMVRIRIVCSYERYEGGDQYSFKAARFRPGWKTINVGDDSHHIKAPVIKKDHGERLTVAEIESALVSLNISYVYRLMKKYGFEVTDKPEVVIA